MVDNPFTYQLYDLRSGAYLGRLPLTQMQFGSQLMVTGSPGSASGQLDIASPAVQALGPLTASSPARTFMAIDYLGSLIWGGIIWPRNYDYDDVNRKLTVTATEGWSYFQNRMQATDYSSPPYSGITGTGTEMAIWDATLTAVNDNGPGLWDAVLIAWQIISDALTQVTYGNILGGLSIAANGYTSVSSYLNSGTATPLANYLSANYPLASLQQVHTIVSQLAQNGYLTGFDFGLDVGYSAGPDSPIVGTVNLSYPVRGRTYAENQLVLNSGSAITYSLPEDGSQAANTMYEQGASGSLSVSQNEIPLEGEGYPVLEMLKSRSNIMSPNLLLLLAELGIADLYTNSYPVATPSVTLDAFSSSIPLGDFVVGDNCRWLVPTTDGAGGLFDPRIPDGLDEEWRITGYNVNVGDEGQSTIQFNLALPPALEITGPALADTPISITTLETFTSLALSDGPVSYWPLNETSGTTAFDLMGVLNGTYLGSTSPNLASNPSFESGTTGWAPRGSDNTIAQSNAVTAFDGSFVLASTTVTTGGIYVDNTGNGVAVTGSVEYTLSFYAQAATVGEQVAAEVVWNDSSHTLISTNTGTISNDAVGSWTRYSVTATAPSNAAWCILRLSLPSTTSGNVHYLDAVQFTQTSAVVDYSSTQGVTLGQPGLLYNDPDRAVLFDHGCVQLPFNSVVNPPEFTYEAWLAPVINGAGTQGIWDCQGASSTGILIYTGATGAVTIQPQNGSSHESVGGANGILVNGQRTHVVTTYDGITFTVYVNGVSYKTSVYGYAVNTGTDEGIASRGNSTNEALGGTWEKFAVYNYPLSPTQIYNHYLAGTQAFR